MTALADVPRETSPRQVAPTDVFVPVEMRWRHVSTGDVMVGKGGLLWAITAAPGQNYGMAVAQHGTTTHSARVDPDEVVTVLVWATERDAVELVREHLGGRLIPGGRIT